METGRFCSHDAAKDGFPASTPSQSPLTWNLSYIIVSLFRGTLFPTYSIYQDNSCFVLLTRYLKNSARLPIGRLMLNIRFILQITEPLRIVLVSLKTVCCIVHSFQHTSYLHFFNSCTIFFLGCFDLIVSFRFPPQSSHVIY